MGRNDTKIDSFKLFIPLDKVTMKNVDRYTTLHVNKASGEVEHEKAPYISFEAEGTGVGIKVVTAPYGRSKMAKGASIAIPSKILGANYLDGINQDNIRQVHQYLNSITDDFNVTMENLLNGRASDIDFCLDGQAITENEFKTFSKELKTLCRQVGIEHYNGNKKGEFYLQTRSTATNRTPFAKMYQKAVEYIGSEHQKAFFKSTDPRLQSTRAEVTIKNKAMLQKFSNCGIQSSTFLHVLEGNYSNIVSNVFDHYFAPSTKKIARKMIIDPSKLKPLDLMFYSQMLYELNINKDITGLALTDLIFDRNTLAMDSKKSRALRDKRKQIEDIYKTYFGAKTKANLNNFNKYMKKIGLMN